LSAFPFFLRRLTLAAALLAVAAAAEDPGGWSKARWGNTDDEIIRAFDGDVIRFDHRDEANHARVGIESMELAGTKFRVYMVPGADDRLNSVLITPCQHDDATDAVFQTLGGLLVQKYGNPWKSDEGNTTQLQWTFKTTIITLSRIRIPEVKFQLVHLQYKRKDASELDKM
jgi:hypothetical protein